MNDVLTLIRRKLAADGYTVEMETRRDVFCRLDSVSRSEFIRIDLIHLVYPIFILP